MERKTAAGRKPWDEIVIFKTLVLQALYNLSDDWAEYQIRNQFSFMRFLGLSLENRVPDATTVWLYREKLAQAGLVAAQADDLVRAISERHLSSPLLAEVASFLHYPAMASTSRLAYLLKAVKDALLYPASKSAMHREC